MPRRDTLLLLAATVTAAITAAETTVAAATAAAATAAVEAMAGTEARSESPAPAADATMQPLRRATTASKADEAISIMTAGAPLLRIIIVTPGITLVPHSTIIAIIMTGETPLLHIIIMAAAAPHSTTVILMTADKSVVRGAAVEAAAAGRKGEPIAAGAARGAPGGQRRGVTAGQAGLAAGAPPLALAALAVKQHEEGATGPLVKAQEAVAGARALAAASGSRSRKRGTSATTATTFKSKDSSSTTPRDAQRTGRGRRETQAAAVASRRCGAIAGLSARIRSRVREVRVGLAFQPPVGIEDSAKRVTHVHKRY
jgi:hypothetical protein